jgi:hypothetical protein
MANPATCLCVCLYQFVGFGEHTRFRGRRVPGGGRADTPVGGGRADAPAL